MSGFLYIKNGYFGVTFYYLELNFCVDRYTTTAELTDHNKNNTWWIKTSTNHSFNKCKQKNLMPFLKSNIYTSYREKKLHVFVINKKIKKSLFSIEHWHDSKFFVMNVSTAFYSFLCVNKISFSLWGNDFFRTNGIFKYISTHNY